MWINQTIRNTNAKTKAKHFKRMWLEVNNQGYEVLKSGDLYTLSFSLYRGRKGRIPLEVHSASHTEVINKLITSEAKQLKEVKRLEQRERRIMTHINHVISRELVQFAKDFGMGLRFEDLTGIRQTSKQRKKTKSDAGDNRDSWAFYQLEIFTRYKAIRAGIPVQSVPAPYTSKSDHRNGVIGKRNGDWFKGFDGYRCNADWNASQNIGQWFGFSCPLSLQSAVAAMAMADAEGAVNDSPLSSGCLSGRIHPPLRQPLESAFFRWRSVKKRVFQFLPTWRDQPVSPNVR